MRIPYGFTLTSSGTLEINRSEANVVRMVFDFYMAGASLGKVVDMLHAKQISSPTHYLCGPEIKSCGQHQPTFYTEELFRMIIDRGKNTLNRAPKH